LGSAFGFGGSGGGSTARGAGGSIAGAGSGKATRGASVAVRIFGPLEAGAFARIPGNKSSTIACSAMETPTHASIALSCESG
jgi:hypothetical protein